MAARPTTPAPANGAAVFMAEPLEAAAGVVVVPPAVVLDPLTVLPEVPEVSVPVVVVVPLR
jgi:hypothetical protein